MRHVFEEEPKLPRDNESLYVTGYKQNEAEAMLEDWNKRYGTGNGIPFHKMKFREFKRSLDLTFGNSRHALRFDLWDYITNHYLYCNQNKLSDLALAYIQDRRNDITTRINNGVKIKTEPAPKSKRAHVNR